MRLGFTHIALIPPLLFSEVAAQENPPAQMLKADPPTVQAGETILNLMERSEKHFDVAGRGRGTGYRQYMRTLGFAAPRSYPSGEFVNTTALTWLNHFRSQRSPEYLARREAAAASGIGVGDWRPVRAVRAGTDKEGSDVGRINVVAFHPTQAGKLYLGTPAAGLWGSQDDGTTWKPLTDDLPMLGISDIALDPGRPDTIYILTGDGEGGYGPLSLPSVGIMKSLNGGRNWQSTGLSWGVSKRELGHQLAIHPTQPAIMLAATTAGLLRTDDGWDHYTTVRRNLADDKNAPADEFWDVLFHPANPSIVYASSTTIVYRSNNAGQTWTALGGGLPDVSGNPRGTPKSNRIRLAVTPKSPNTLYVLYGSSDGFSIGLYRSDNSGDTFERRSASNRQPANPGNPPAFDLTKSNILGRDPNDFDSQSSYDLAMAVSPDDAELVHVGGIDTWRSKDGGRTWDRTSKWDSNRQDNYTHADIHAMAYGDKSLYVASDGGLYRSRDAGTTWTGVSNITTGLSAHQIYALCATPQDQSLLLYGAQDNGTYKLRIDGEIHKVVGGDGFVCQINPKDSRYVYASSQNGYLYRSANGGEKFDEIKRPMVGDYYVSGPWLTPYILSPADPFTMFACFADLWRASEPAFRWQNLTNGALGPSIECRHVEVAPSDPNTIYVAKQGEWRFQPDGRTPFLGGGGVFRSVDGGVTWQNITRDLPLAQAAITNMAVSPSDARRAWVTFSGYKAEVKVWATVDGGETWHDLSQGLPNLPVNAIAARAGATHGVYVGTDDGVYYRDDRGREWLPFAHNLPSTVISALLIDEAGKRLLAATYSQGIWQTEIRPPCTDACEASPRTASSDSSSRASSAAAPALPPPSYTGPLDIFE
jgi:photosystem II stability/assembly factor-like uncharacterized protein